MFLEGEGISNMDGSYVLINSPIWAKRFQTFINKWTYAKTNLFAMFAESLDPEVERSASLTWEKFCNIA